MTSRYLQFRAEAAPQRSGALLLALLTWSAAVYAEPAASPSDADLAAEVAALKERLDALESDLADQQAAAAKRPSVVWTGQLQADFYAVRQDAASLAALGDVQDGAAFRRARLGMLGEHGPTEYRIEVDFALAGRPSFLDVFAGVRDLPGIGRVRVGHFFEPFSLERVTPNRYMTFMERSLPDQAFVPARNLGVMANNNLLDENATWAVGYFRADSDVFGDDAGDDFQSALTGRVTALAYFDDSCGGRRYAHLGLGYSYRAAGDDTIRFRSQPEARLGATTPNFPFVADTGSLAGSHAQLVGFEAAVVEGPASLQAEYNLVPTALDGGSATFSAWYLTASYFLTGEHRPYRRDIGVFDRVQPLRPFARYGPNDRVVCLGPGAWEVAARVSRLDLTEGAVAGGELDHFTLGLNWHLTPYLRCSANWVHSLADLPASGESATDYLGGRVGYEF